VTIPERPFRSSRQDPRPAGVAFASVTARLVALSLLLAAAASADSTFDRAHGRCEIQFFATSTMRDFSGGADARPFLLSRHDGASGGPEWWSATVEVAVAELLTGYDQRDSDMHWMLDANDFPSIVAEFPHIASEAYQGERLDEAVPLEFRLTIRDVTRPMSAKISHWVRSGDRASFDAEFDVSASSFELKVPTLLGLLRVGDTITVRAHVELELERDGGTRR
jgi:polyisoprenoid-binding protein YceI